jgi:hypothetical protein
MYRSSWMSARAQPGSNEVLGEKSRLSIAGAFGFDEALSATLTEPFRKIRRARAPSRDRCFLQRDIAARNDTPLLQRQS